MHGNLARWERDEQPLDAAERKTLLELDEELLGALAAAGALSSGELAETVPERFRRNETSIRVGGSCRSCGRRGSSPRAAGGALLRRRPALS
ncbi:hypothetical protein [Conexibacter arvalis]|uniref:Uncharacterized protein n=1 Tax=Conexibacter arvalis TaxID=912552 RepID=A0A840IGT9_9ACTN|nr:hypothetical protein [Conexibacter arvalis]MBB4663451.1 hypothetical protein [Conexibacter arvalis]